MKIYISGPLTAPTHDEVLNNIHCADYAGRAVVKKGHIPFIPHTMCAGWQNDSSLSLVEFARIDLEWLTLCDAIYMLPTWKNSTGAIWEYTFAKWLNKNIIFDLEKLIDLTEDTNFMSGNKW